jgi:hypothetical protein
VGNGLKNGLFYFPFFLLSYSVAREQFGFILSWRQHSSLRITREKAFLQGQNILFIWAGCTVTWWNVNRPNANRPNTNRLNANFLNVTRPNANWPNVNWLG